MDSGEGWKVADITLAEEGSRRVDWARSRMPVLALLQEEARQSKPLAGMTVAGCLHVTKETAVLIETLEAAGAKVAWSGCNPLSTQDDVAAWLASQGYSIYAWHGQSVEDFYWCIDRTIEANPTLTLVLIINPSFSNCSCLLSIRLFSILKSGIPYLNKPPILLFLSYNVTL